MQPEESRTVLLADDEPQVVKIVAQMLRREGFHVLEATSGEEALEISRLHTGPIHLLLTDIVMPGMNGRDLADRLAAARAGLRVLYMSGFLRDSILKYYGISITGIPFLQKPFTRETLAQKVHEVLDAPMRSAGRAS